MSRLQSAMEFLMTYGWAILIVAVVLGALFQLGVFNKISLSSNSCIPNVGYKCASATLNGMGYINITFGQLGQQITVTQTICILNASTPTASTNTLYLLSPPQLTTGQLIPLTFQCPAQPNTVGSQLSGYLWIKYYDSQSSTLQTANIAKFTAKVITLSSISTQSSSYTQPVPQVTLSGGGAIDQGQSTTITANPSGGVSPYSYQWYQKSPGSSSYSIISGATSSSYTFSATSGTTTGSYSFNVILTDAAFASNTAAIPASATLNPQLAITLSPLSQTAPPYSCQAVAFTNTTSGGTPPANSFTYSYAVTPNSFSRTGNAITFTAANTAYTVTLTVTDSAGGSSQSSSHITTNSLTIPGSILHYMPICITNGQGSSTPSTFQQQATINNAGLGLTSYEASNLQNVEFFDQNGNIVPSWLESGNSNSGTSTYWLKLNSAIPSGGTYLLYMGFASTGTNLFGGSVGEAPQLSGTYAQYDSGASVFSFYDNFAGTVLSSKWTAISGSSGGATGGYAVNNNILLSTGATFGSSWMTIYTPSTQIQPSYFESLVISTTGIVENKEAYIIGEATATSEGSNYGTLYPSYYHSITIPSSYLGINCVTCSSQQGTVLASYANAGTSNFISGLGWSGTTQTAAINYVTEATTSNTQIPIANNYYFINMIHYAFPTDYPTATVQWTRGRAYPPSGVMPGVSFGPVT